MNRSVHVLVTSSSPFNEGLSLSGRTDSNAHHLLPRTQSYCFLPRGYQPSLGPGDTLPRDSQVSPWQLRHLFLYMQWCLLHRVVIAEWENIVFYEYLPKIIGPSRMSHLRDYHGYDPTVNPAIANAFATAAYRFGHSQIMPVFQRLDENFQPHPVGHLLLRDAFFAPFRLLEEGGIDPLLRGLIASGVKRRSSISGLNSNLTEALFVQVPLPSHCPLCSVCQ